MFLGLAWTEDVNDTDATSEEGIRKEGPMALPWHCFSAHDRRSHVCGTEDEVIQSLDELRRGHMVRVSSEGVVPPALVAIIRPRPAIPA
jgi:hypothetical protein